MLGQGTFGQVAKCICQQTGEVVAIKVIKNQTAFYHQARVEVGVLQYLNRLGDADDQHHIVRMHNFFVFKEHLCLVFELLNLNLYELIKQNQFRGLSMRLLRIFLSQVGYSPVRDLACHEFYKSVASIALDLFGCVRHMPHSGQASSLAVLCMPLHTC